LASITANSSWGWIHPASLIRTNRNDHAPKD
jgi:hypothetical protein